MAQNINLIPQEEKVEQAKVKVVKASTVFAVILLIIVVGVVVYFRYEVSTIRKQIGVHESSTNSLRMDIQDLSEIEVVARNLDGKFRALRYAFDKRVYFSTLLTELKKRIPSGVDISDFSMRESTINISGSGNNYIGISTFLSNLSSPTSEVATEGMEELFTSVSLNSVTLDNRTGKAKYTIIMDFSEEVLEL